jgi:flagellar biosynthesis/type III secretory pathway M-ring protein FliF/YscJ
MASRDLSRKVVAGAALVVLVATVCTVVGISRRSRMTALLQKLENTPSAAQV